eukprot:jgi/Mesvir1/29226/Mv18821-RA.1
MHISVHFGGCQLPPLPLKVDLPDDMTMDALWETLENHTRRSPGLLALTTDGCRITRLTLPNGALLPRCGPVRSILRPDDIVLADFADKDANTPLVRTSMPPAGFTGRKLLGRFLAVVTGALLPLAAVLLLPEGMSMPGAQAGAMAGASLGALLPGSWHSMSLGLGNPATWQLEQPWWQSDPPLSMPLGAHHTGGGWTTVHSNEGAKGGDDDRPDGGRGDRADIHTDTQPEDQVTGIHRGSAGFRVTEEWPGGEGEPVGFRREDEGSGTGITVVTSGSPDVTPGTTGHAGVLVGMDQDADAGVLGDGITSDRHLTTRHLLLLVAGRKQRDGTQDASIGVTSVGTQATDLSPVMGAAGLLPPGTGTDDDADDPGGCDCPPMAEKASPPPPSYQASRDPATLSLPWRAGCQSTAYAQRGERAYFWGQPPEYPTFLDPMVPSGPLVPPGELLCFTCEEGEAARGKAPGGRTPRGPASTRPPGPVPCWSGCCADCAEVLSLVSPGYNVTSSVNKAISLSVPHVLPTISREVKHVTMLMRTAGGETGMVHFLCVPGIMRRGHLYSISHEPPPRTCADRLKNADIMVHTSMALYRMGLECGFQQLLLPTSVRVMRTVMPYTSLPVNQRGLVQAIPPGFPLSIVALPLDGHREMLEMRDRLPVVTSIPWDVIAKAALFDVLFAVCDRSSEHAFVTESGTLTLMHHFKALGVGDMLGVGTGACELNSIFVPGSARHKELADKLPAVARHLDYRCRVNGGIGNNFPPRLKLCLMKFKHATPPALMAEYGLLYQSQAMLLTQRASALLQLGLEATIESIYQKGNPSWQMPPPDCDG